MPSSVLKGPNRNGVARCTRVCERPEFRSPIAEAGWGGWSWAGRIDGDYHTHKVPINTYLTTHDMHV